MFERGVRGGRLAAVLFVPALALAGCESFTKVTNPPPVDPNLYPAQYRTEVLDLLRHYVGNPVKLRDTGLTAPTLQQIGKERRYESCVRYNERGEDGRYLGVNVRVAIYYGGRLNQFVETNSEMCSKAVYQPFPEAEKLVP